MVGGLSPGVSGALCATWGSSVLSWPHANPQAWVVDGGECEQAFADWTALDSLGSGDAGENVVENATSSIWTASSLYGEH